MPSNDATTPDGGTDYQGMPAIVDAPQPPPEPWRTWAVCSTCNAVTADVTAHTAWHGAPP